MAREPDIYKRVKSNDYQSTAETNRMMLDMVRAKIEEGKVESLALFMVSNDADDPHGRSYIGSRFIVRPWHLDAMEDLYSEMMEALSSQYNGLTPAEVRAAREGKTS
jgi:hypothetical protein